MRKTVRKNMKKNSSMTRKALSLLLVLTFVMGILSANILLKDAEVVSAASASSNPDPVYNRAAAPEVAIFNALTGDNTAFYKAVLSSSDYNAVQAGYFGSLRYSTEISGQKSYSWSGFSNSNIYALRQDNPDIQIGYSVTRTSNYHKHTSGIYKYNMTNWSNTSLGFNLGGFALGGLINYSGYSKSQDTIRQGNNRFSVFIPQGNKSLDLAFNPEVIRYDNNERVCSCGGTSKGCMVCFYDGEAPYFTRLEIQNGSGEDCRNFKPGDTVNIVLTCSETLRFADDSARGKGDVYIGLKLNGSTTTLYAHLTKLDGNRITFTYDAPADLTKIYDVVSIDLTGAPEGGTALLNREAVIPLKQLKANGAFTATRPDGAKEIGITKTTSPVTDMAGNAVYLDLGDPSNIAWSFNIDGEKPFAAAVDIVAVTNNADIKVLLGKTDMEPNNENYEDNSDNFLGVGDRLSLKVYMNEVVESGRVENGIWMGGMATMTTNIKKSDGSYLTFNATPMYTVNAASANLGSQFGLGASKGKVSVLESSGKVVESGMIIDDVEGKIRITKIEFFDMKDLAGNIADNQNTVFSPNQQYRIDTEAPTAEVSEVTGANKTDYGFRVPFKVTDNTGGSGVLKLPASLTLGGGTFTGKLQYAVTADAAAPTDWSDGAEGSALPFLQTGDTQYLHVKAIPGEPYDVSMLSFTLSDYAGNMATTTQAGVSGVGFDSVGPAIIAGTSSRAYDNTSNKGALTANIIVKDPGGVSSVQYRWNDGTELNAESDGWTDAEGTTGGTSVTATVTAEVDSGAAFRQTLWIKATDEAGNVSITGLGEYSYNLAGIEYALEYPTNVVIEPSLKISSIQTGGALVFDVLKPGDYSTHYVMVCEDKYQVNYPNIFDDSQQWFTAAIDETDGIKFTGLSAANGNPFGQYSDKNYTGNMEVRVYSGTKGADQSADISRPEWSSASTSDITVTTNAKSETIQLHVSYQFNSNSDVFSQFELNIPMIMGIGEISTPWTYSEDSQFGPQYKLSTLEGQQVSFDLGTDKNGWNFSDIDWENSFLELRDDQDNRYRLCGIGSGPVQTITLPASEHYVTGHYWLWLILNRHSSDRYYYNNCNVYIDATEPGSLKLETLAKGDFASASYEPITFDPGKTIYIPTQQITTFLSVDVLDPDGVTPHQMTIPDTYEKVGEVSVIAWDTAHPDKKVALTRECLAEDEQSGELYLHSLEDTETTGKRLLTFGIGADSTNTSGGVLGLTPDQDSVIALQVRYANGRYSDITYLTLHPVSIGLGGTVSTLPVRTSTWIEDPQVLSSEWTGVYTVDPGKAAVVFTPDEAHSSVIASSGLRLYCRLGAVSLPFYGSTIDHKNYGYYSKFDFEYYAEPIEMTAQGDGSYAASVPGYERLWSSALSYYQFSSILRTIYCIYAEDDYGNRIDVGYAPAVIIADGQAPEIQSLGISVDANGKYTATYRIDDNSLYSFAQIPSNDKTTHITPSPMILGLSYNSEYAGSIGMSGEGLTLTADVTNGDYVWTASDSNSMGIRKVTASLVQDNYWYVNFFGSECPTEVYMTVTVEGYVSPRVTTAMDMTLNLTATDGHGNTCEPVGATASVTGVTPTVTDKIYKRVAPDSEYNTDRALYLTFNVPVQPQESWINRNIEGYATEWHDAFPIWKDGIWDITFTDLFGTVYTQSLTLEDVIGEYGFDLGFSTLDYVSAGDGVTVTFAPDDDSEQVTYGGRLGSYTFTENGTYYLTRNGGGESDSLPINLNNIVSGGPEETLYFYFDEFKEQHEAGAADQFRGITTGSVTVSYKTSRETSPVGDTTLTLKDGDSDSFSLQYYDIPTAFTYTISGRLSDYGIILAAPPEPYADTDAPNVELVSIWKQQGGGFLQAEAFPGSAESDAVKSAIGSAGAVQSYNFVVNASDYSKWKVIVRSTAPTDLSYASARSDTIPGVSVSGNNVLVTKDVTGDFCIVVVDNAKEDSAAGNDNFTCITIPYGSYRFDTIAPEIITNTVADTLYSQTVYIKATDTDNAGNDTGSSVTLSGVGVVNGTYTIGETTYTQKLVFTDNDTVIVVTATDAAGNSATASIQVTGIDMTAPTLTVTWSPCFKDQTTGKLDISNPTIGPVNTDVVAHITSDKEIKDVTAYYIDPYYGGMIIYDFTGTNPAPEWGTIDFTSQRVSVHFSDSYEGTDTIVTLNITAPNGKTTPVTLTLKSGVIDKDPPQIVIDHIEEFKRDGYDVPYTIKMYLRPTEEAYCTNSGPIGELYYDDVEHPHLLEVMMTDNSPQTFIFVDKAGNRTIFTVPDTFGPSLPDIDNVAPTLSVTVPDNTGVTSGSVSVTVTASENCTLTAGDNSVTCGTLSKGVDRNGNEIWTGTVSASRNGTFRLTAADGAGNTATAFFTVNNIDKTLPTISFIPTTVSLRQDSTSAELKALLDAGVSTWDNVGVEPDTLAHDDSGVKLGTVGVYTVTYTVRDTSGNIGQAVRYVKVIDKNQPVIAVDGALTEQNGVKSIKTGTHKLSVSGLKTANEPYTLKLIKGIWSSGQTKRASSSIAVGTDGSFTITAPGVYTLYITTQSRQTYRTLIYVEN